MDYIKDIFNVNAIHKFFFGEISKLNSFILDVVLCLFIIVGVFFIYCVYKSSKGEYKKGFFFGGFLDDFIERAGFFQKALKGILSITLIDLILIMLSLLFPRLMFFIFIILALLFLSLYWANQPQASK